MDSRKGLAQELAKEIFLNWLCTDRIDRQPPTHSELARLLGIQLATLVQWKKSPEFTIEIVKRLRMRYSDRLAGVIDDLSWRAEKGDIRAMDLFLHFLNFNPQSESKTGTETTYEEFAKLVRDSTDDWEPPTWAVELAASDGWLTDAPATTADPSAQDGSNRVAGEDEKNALQRTTSEVTNTLTVLGGESVPSPGGGS